MIRRDRKCHCKFHSEPEGVPTSFQSKSAESTHNYLMRTISRKQHFSQSMHFLNRAYWSKCYLLVRAHWSSIIGVDNSRVSATLCRAIASRITTSSCVSGRRRTKRDNHYAYLIFGDSLKMFFFRILVYWLQKKHWLAWTSVECWSASSVSCLSSTQTTICGAVAPRLPVVPETLSI